MIPKPDRISVLEALKRIREIYHVDAPTAEEIFIQIVRNGTVPLWEKRDGRYQEVWYWDEVERCSIHGQSEAALVTSIFDTGVVWVLTGSPAGPIQVRPSRWFVNWSAFKKQLTDLELTEGRIVVRTSSDGKPADGGRLKAKKWLNANWLGRNRVEQAKARCFADAQKEITGLTWTAFYRAWADISKANPDWKMSAAGSRGGGK